MGEGDSRAAGWRGARIKTGGALPGSWPRQGKTRDSGVAVWVRILKVGDFDISKGSVQAGGGGSKGARRRPRGLPPRAWESLLRRGLSERWTDSVRAGELSRDGQAGHPECGLVRKLGTARARARCGAGRGLGPSTHLGAVSSRSGGRHWWRRPRGASLPSLRRGPGRAQGSSPQPRRGPRLRLRRAAGAEQAPRSCTGRAGGRRAGRGLLPPPPPPRRAAPRSPPRAPPAPRAASYSRAAAAAPGSDRRCRILLSVSQRRCCHRTGFLRPLRPLPAARAGPSDGRGGTRRLRGPGPGGGARRAGREEPREKGRGAGATRAASC